VTWCWRSGFDRRQRQVADSLDRCGGDPDAGGTEPAVEQDLHERAAEGVAHDDRRALQPADDAVVVIDDPGDIELRDR